MYFIKIPRNVNKKIQVWSELGKENEEYNIKISRELALEARRRIRAHIDRQDLKWKPLKDGYKEAKEKSGLSGKIWEATKFLRNSIKIIKVRDKRFIGYNVGFDEMDKYPGTDTSVGLVAKTLEYGSPSRNIPPRPLFRRVRSELFKEIRAYVSEKNSDLISKIKQKLNR